MPTTHPIAGSTRATAPTIRFEIRHSNLGRLGAVAAPFLELGLFGILVSVGGIAPDAALVLAGPLLLVSLGHAWFLFAARYEVGDGVLRIVHGPWRRETPLTDILEARPLHALDRGPVIELKLAYGRRLVLSPVERGRFLACVEAGQPLLRSQAGQVM